jgi:hypothetical protein
MTIENLIGRLDAVRQRGAGRWAARCPAHPDKSPSLSISEGNKGLLLRCWAGCTIAEICQAIGVAQRELFYDSQPNQRAVRAARAHRERKMERDWVDGFSLDALREADYFIRSRQGIDLSSWPLERLHDELNALADAYHLLESEDLDGLCR